LIFNLVFIEYKINRPIVSIDYGESIDIDSLIQHKLKNLHLLNKIFSELISECEIISYFIVNKITDILLANYLNCKIVIYENQY
jgi:hypothetical protein